MEEILERKEVGGKQIIQIVSYLIAEGRKQEIEKIYPEETQIIDQLTKITNCKIVINKQELREKISAVKEKYKDDEQMQETIEKLIENAKRIRKEQIEESVKFNNKRKVKEIRKNKIQEKTITKINRER